METTARPRRRDQVWLRRSGPEAVLVDDGADALHVVNDTAVALWELCDGSTSVAEMVDAVCELFSVRPEVAGADVERLLDDLARLGVIDWTSGHGAQHPV